MKGMNGNTTLPHASTYASAKPYTFCSCHKHAQTCCSKPKCFWALSQARTSSLTAVSVRIEWWCEGACHILPRLFQQDGLAGAEVAQEGTRVSQQNGAAVATVATTMRGCFAAQSRGSIQAWSSCHISTSQARQLIGPAVEVRGHGPAASLLVS